MIKKQSVQKDNLGQFNRFVETARNLECDEDKNRFEKSLGKIAAYKPPKYPIKKAANPPRNKVNRVVDM
jgi:hypothetical protein